MSWLQSQPDKPWQTKRVIVQSDWDACRHCQVPQTRCQWQSRFGVCAHCQAHRRIAVVEWQKLLLDQIGDMVAGRPCWEDPLAFVDRCAYRDRVAQWSDGQEALSVVNGTVAGRAVVLMVFDFAHMGGSMGMAVGERFYAGVLAAIKRCCPVVCVISSGGARMQEGVFSLWQMGKTVQAIRHLHHHRLPLINVLADPTTGGVSASLAMMGDVLIAEPGALIAFTGPRVIEEALKIRLPADFQRAERVMDNGHVDMIVPRLELVDKLAQLLRVMQPSVVEAGVEKVQVERV